MLVRLETKLQSFVAAEMPCVPRIGEIVELVDTAFTVTKVCYAFARDGFRDIVVHLEERNS